MKGIERRQHNKLVPIREVFDIWVETLKKLFNPGKNVTVDEQLMPFRGECLFTQYLPMKSRCYGMKILAACDSETAYACNVTTGNFLTAFTHWHCNCETVETPNIFFGNRP